jgi:DNA invertase Pin-like site-specific DNA recombinase
MARPYSSDFLTTLNTLNPDNLGVQLAKLCVKANLPTLYIARKLGVSRYTIHSWFRGQYIRKINKVKVESFMQELDKGFNENKLPVSGLSYAKQYLDSIEI